jgi:hypothetical protein
LAIGLQAPYLTSLTAKTPKVSGRMPDYSRFRETAAGDWVRSSLRGGRGSRTLGGHSSGSLREKLIPRDRAGSEAGLPGSCENRERRCYQRRSDAPTRGTGPIRLALAGATRSGSAGVGSPARDPLARLRRIQVESIGTTINFRRHEGRQTLVTQRLALLLAGPGLAR